MGPIWIVVIVFKPELADVLAGKPDVVTVEEFRDEVSAHTRYMAAVKLDYRHVYMASVRGEAHA